MYVGFHINIANKQFKKSIENAYNKYNINAIQFFLKTPRQKILSKISDHDLDQCRKFVYEYNIKLFVHSTYLINIATLDDMEYKINTVCDDINNIYLMGGLGAIFHVGKYLKMNKEIALNNMKTFIKKILSEINFEQKFILETAAGCGTELLYNIEEFGNFFNSFDENEKKKLGVCIDTCHVFSAGYDLKTIDKVKDFINLVEKYISWENVLVIHLNDSEKDCGCRVDRHQNLCNGYITKDNVEGLKYFCNYCSTNFNIPIILETPLLESSKLNEIKIVRDWIKNL